MTDVTGSRKNSRRKYPPEIISQEKSPQIFAPMKKCPWWNPSRNCPRVFQMIWNLLKFTTLLQKNDDLDKENYRSAIVFISYVRSCTTKLNQNSQIYWPVLERIIAPSIPWCECLKGGRTHWIRQVISILKITGLSQRKSIFKKYLFLISNQLWRAILTKNL